MRLLVLGMLAVLGCSGESAEAEPEAADAMGESADELTASSTFTYRCTNLTKGNGYDDVSHLRVRASKVVWNETKTFTTASGALTAKHDTDYHPKGAVKYVRYEYLEHTPHGGLATHEWKLEPALVQGGKKMSGGDLGGFAVRGIPVDWYGSTKYVCFRE